MRARTLKILIAWAVFSVAALTVWPGCISVPAPSVRKSILARKSEDYAFTKPPPPSRAEVISQVGEPDVYYADIRVAGYRINELSRRKLWLCLGVIPMGVHSISIGDFEIAFIEFDEHDRVRETGMGSTYDKDSREAAKRWLAAEEQEREKQKPKHGH